MKFDKQFSAYIQTQDGPGLSYVEFKRLKKLLKHCRLEHDAEVLHSVDYERPQAQDHGRIVDPSSSSSETCPPFCAVCDRTFFPILMKETGAVVGCFNSRAQRLLQIHLASGFRKFYLRLKSRQASKHLELIHEEEKLVSYVSMNALAIQKILKKYDKVHSSKRGRAFRSRLQSMHVELLQSPWLIELIAFDLHSRDSTFSLTERSLSCSYDFEGSKPTISCSLFGSANVEIDLTCSICLEMVFDPVALRCGHIFCNSCACSAAFIPTVEGLKSADQSARCPLCREENVYKDAVHLTELGTLISTRCKDYWKERLQRERVERLEQVKKHWDQQCRAALGF